MNDLRNFLLLFLLLHGLYGLGQSSYDIPLPDKGELSVDVYDASIRVIGISGNEASVKILQYGSNKPANTKQSPNYDVKLEGNKLLVFKKEGTPSGGGLRNILIEVKIPTSYACKLNTYYGKSLKVEGVNGDLILDNYYGGIEVKDPGGRLEVNSFESLVSLQGLKASAIVHSTDGNIQARFEEIPPNFASIFSSNEGNISISLPGDASLIVGMDTFNGKIESDFKLGIPAGDFSAKKGFNPKFSYRSINQGDSQSFLTIKNYFGNINLLKN